MNFQAINVMNSFAAKLFSGDGAMFKRRAFMA